MAAAGNRSGNQPHLNLSKRKEKEKKKKERCCVSSEQISFWGTKKRRDHGGRGSLTANWHENSGKIKAN